jgi:putative FmdB family regulatory protein
MPLYEYQCCDCGAEFELLLRGEEKPRCPTCGRENLARLLSVVSGHTASSSQIACPAKDICGISRCCGSECGLGREGDS